MTTLEIILSIILWVILGIYIAYKRDWYPEKNKVEDMPSSLRILFSIIFAPLNFLWVFSELFFLKKWNNE